MRSKIKAIQELGMALVAGCFVAIFAYPDLVLLWLFIMLAIFMATPTIMFALKLKSEKDTQEFECEFCETQARTTEKDTEKDKTRPQSAASRRDIKARRLELPRDPAPTGGPDERASEIHKRTASGSRRILSGESLRTQKHQGPWPGLSEEGARAIEESGYRIPRELSKKTRRFLASQAKTFGARLAPDVYRDSTEEAGNS